MKARLITRALRWSVAITLAVAGLASSPASAKCEDLVPVEARVRAPPRLVTAEDIVAMRDVGERDAVGIGKPPLAVSPDGRQVAFVIVRAEVATNGYCRALVVLDLEAGARPRIVDRGGDYIPITAPVRGLVVSPGAPDVVTPVWSPDGRTVAYRKRVSGRTEAWIARADGGGARKVARLESDVEDIAWSADGARLLVAWRPGLAAQRERFEREALSGYLYDDRFQPAYQMEPLPTAEQLAVSSLDLATGSIEKIDEAEAAHRFPGVRLVVATPRQILSQGGRHAQLVPAGDGLLSAMRISAETPDGRLVTCMAASCAGAIKAPFWIGEDLVFLRLEGWGQSSYALYRWRPGSPAPHRILAGEDMIQGCVAAAREALCLIDSAASPRKIVAIDPRSGDRRILFDPNPEFAALRLGEVRRLKIQSDRGYETWADLVLPPGYRGGRVPLVVVQYRSRGFLRGGVGADYPIFAFATRGIAVLSFERPQFVGSKASSEAEFYAANTRDWADRRSVQGALERAINEVVRLGVVDPARIGMTGLSDGSTTTAFTLINSRYHLAAAAMSSCCMEPGMVLMTGGPRFAEAMKAQGYPPFGSDDRAFWAPMSVARNASRIDTPILMQLADREYMLGLEAWTALKEAGKPVEMIVYPNEYHQKWQPAHLYAGYVRSLDWFDFWLLNRRDPDPAKAAQYERWDELRRLRDQAERRPK